jgi:hypothetical protein
MSPGRDVINRNRARVFLALSVTAILLLGGVWLVERGTTAAAGRDSLRPVFSPSPGYYEDDLLLRLDTAYPQARILFTTDGSVPTPENAAVYGRPLPIPAGTADVTVVRARLQLSDGSLGPVSNASYFTLQATLPVLSLVVAPEDLWHPDGGILTNPLARGIAWERPVDVTYLEAGDEGQGRHIGFQVAAGLRVHGNNSRTAAKKSLRLYFRQEYGLSRLEYPLFAPLPNQPEYSSVKRLVLHSGGQEFAHPGWTFIRVPLINWLAAQTHSVMAPSRPALVYLNGESQGIYLLRPRIDDWFFDDLYHTDIVEQWQQDARWQEFLQFLTTHDLRDPAHYAFVQSRIDLDNFIDYHLLHLYAGNTDWVYANVRRFLPADQGGRWHWLFWDVDWVFGLQQDSGYAFNSIAWFMDSDWPSFNRGALPLRRLLQNPAFEARFLARMDELLNTVLRPEPVAAKVDVLAMELRPDIGYEVARWPSPSDWEHSVAQMREYVQKRPSFLRQHAIEQFDLPGSADFHFKAAAAGVGGVAYNDWLLPPDATTTHFIGITVTVTAVPAPGYRFVKWEESDLPPRPGLTLRVTQSRDFTPRFEPVADDFPRPDDVEFGRIQPGGGRHPRYGQIEGDWLELVVRRTGGVDLRGWRITDNDRKTAADEGSLLLPPHPALARVPPGARVLLVTKQTPANDRTFAQDDLGVADGQLALYLGNGRLRLAQDAWFHLANNDNLVLLAPGPTATRDDDVGIAFTPVGPGPPRVTPRTFGVLQDGVTGAMGRLDEPQ